MTPEEIAKNRKLACIATYDATPDDVGDIQDALLRSLDALEWLKTEFDAHLSMKAELKLADVKAWGRERDARVALESQLSEVREERDSWKEAYVIHNAEVKKGLDALDAADRLNAALRKENEELKAQRDEARALKVPATTDELLVARMETAVARAQLSASQARVMELETELAKYTVHDQLTWRRRLEQAEDREERLRDALETCRNWMSECLASHSAMTEPKGGGA